MATAITGSHFKMSKSAKMRLANFPKGSQARGDFKRQIIEVEHEYNSRRRSAAMKREAE